MMTPPFFPLRVAKLTESQSTFRRFSSMLLSLRLFDTLLGSIQMSSSFRFVRFILFGCDFDIEPIMASCTCVQCCILSIHLYYTPNVNTSRDVASLSFKPYPGLVVQLWQYDTICYPIVSFDVLRESPVVYSLLSLCRNEGTYCLRSSKDSQVDRCTHAMNREEGAIRGLTSCGQLCCWPHRDEDMTGSLQSCVACVGGSFGCHEGVTSLSTCAQL